VEHEAVRSRELWEGVAGVLRNAISLGGIGPGTRLVEDDLAEQFGVSRGPVRDALRELGREGLVVVLPRRGAVVSSPTFSDVREIHQVREILEIGAAKMAMETASLEDLRRLEEHIQAIEAAAFKDFAARLDADMAFHRALVGLPGNRRLASAYEQMLAQTPLMFGTVSLVNPRLRTGVGVAPHREIATALLKRNSAEVERAIRRHYEASASRLLAGGPTGTRLGATEESAT